uniref:Putative odorant binding protein 85 n=1 Tax=Nasonia vitripennis TaxID=7425 RepID=G8B1U0_NASVI|nr:putative odorant binding protein 85 [Nasonia vitripennis]
MRSVLLIFCLSSVAVRVSAHVSPVADSFKACLAESGMTRDDFIKALQSSDDSKAQCIAACTMEKEKFMSDDKINVDAIIAKMEDVSQEIGKVQITDLVMNCAAEAKDKSGKCGVAHSVVRCIHEELRKEGWI